MAIAAGFGVFVSMLLIDRIDARAIEEISILEKELYTWAKVKSATGKISESDLSEIFDDHRNFTFSAEPSERGFLVIASESSKQRIRLMTIVGSTLLAAGGLGHFVIIIRKLLSGKVGAGSDGLNPPRGRR